MPNPYFNVQLAQARRQVLLQEAQQEQLLNELPKTRHSLALYISVKLSLFLLAVWTRLKRFAPHLFFRKVSNI